MKHINLINNPCDCSETLALFGVPLRPRTPQPVSPSVRFLPLGFALGHVCSIMLCLEDVSVFCCWCKKLDEPAEVDRKSVHSTVYQILEVLSLGWLFDISSININIAKWLLHSQFPYLLISSLTFSLPGIYDFFKPTPPKNSLKHHLPLLVFAVQTWKIVKIISAPEPSSLWRAVANVPVPHAAARYRAWNRPGFFFGG